MIGPGEQVLEARSVTEWWLRCHGGTDPGVTPTVQAPGWRIGTKAGPGWTDVALHGGHTGFVTVTPG